MHGLHSSGLLTFFRYLRFFRSESSRRKIRSSFALVILSLSIGCLGDELTREKAAVLLDRPPEEILGDFWFVFARDEGHRAAQEYLDNKTETLLALGLIDGMENQGPAYPGSEGRWKDIVVCQWVLSENVMQYIRGKPIAGKNGAFRLKVVEIVESIGKVTGIYFPGESKSLAVVEYQLVKEITPFGGLNTRKDLWKAESLATQIYSRTAQFQLYDDGWRLK